MNKVITEHRLDELDWLKYFTTTKLAGNFKDEGEKDIFFRQSEIKVSDLVSAEQIHSNKIKHVSIADRGKKMIGVDGLITDDNNVPLIIHTADCAPIAIIDTVNKSIALLHAGRKGTEQQIILKAWELMSKNNKGKYCLAVIGPHIHSCCYPVDITELNIQQLLGIGINKENIIVSPYCTSCRTDLFYSYRKENKTTGRMITLLMKKGEHLK